MSNGTQRLFGKRYQTSDLLGRGGMGEVYRAVDRLTGQTVALKRVISLTDVQDFDTSQDSITYRLALAREFKTLASLRHPHIINVLDYGFDEERQPYVTMELLEQADNFVQAAQERPIAEQVQYVIRLLQALAYLHRRGILHRDLKPSNVLVTENDGLKVLDFGLAVEHEHAKEMVGTIAYMAPEVLQGQPASPSVDLYAVGVMFYEMLMGHHPFDTGNLQKLVWDVLNSMPDLSRLDVMRTTSLSPVTSQEPKNPLTTNLEIDPMPTAAPGELDDMATMLGDAIEDLTKTVVGPPLPPVNQTTEINIEANPIFELSNALENQDVFILTGGAESTSLASIVGKLLSKTPAGRYQHAYEVIVDLANAIGEAVPEESAAIRESFLQAATFVGREGELHQLETALENAEAGQGSAWLVAGESGVGKTRLLEELRIRGLVRGMMVLRGQAVSDGGLSYQLWREPLRRLVLATDVSDLDASILKEIIPDIDDLLDRPIADAMRLDSKEHKQRLQSAILSLFQQQTQPILLLAEDLQWSIESLEILRLLNEMVANLKLLVVGNYRHEERPDLPKDLPGMQVLRLERLSPESIADLSVSMLGEAGRDPALLNLLRRETEGNVFFLVEVVRALAEEARGLDNVGRMSLPRHVLAGGIQTVIRRRLEHVPEHGRWLLRLAAVYGREIDLDILEHADGKIDLDDWLMQCVNSAVLEVQEGEYRFAHDKLRQAALDSIPDDERPMLHRKIAEAIQEVYPDAPEQARVLAQHWRAAGDTVQEFFCVQPAGDYALQISSLAEAIELFQRALELLPLVVSDKNESHSLRASLLIKLGEAQQHTGDYSSAETQIAKGLSIYRTLKDATGMARALSLRADVYWRSGNYTAATQSCQESLELYHSLDDQHGIARVLNRMGMVAFEQGDYPNANQQIQEGLRVAEQISDRVTRATCINNLGAVALRQGDYPAAGRYFQENLAISQESGERWKIASSLNNLGTVSGIQGDFPAASSYFEQALEMCRTIGDRRGLAMALDNLGFLAQLQGDYDRATVYLEESLSMAQAIRNRQGSANSLLNLGHVASAQGNRDLASERFDQALRIAREIEATPVMLEILCGLARLENDAERALGWLGLVLNHPSTSQDTRDLANQVLEPLKANAAPETIEAGLAAGRELELNALVADLIGA
ncbi:MAG: tetratricopeptide repeat protein [Anaerolineae bacterium]|nr:tetratricopeptide repeat protein [Anaerolineae bacterium]